jgi:hypothetical protein
LNNVFCTEAIQQFQNGSPIHPSSNQHLPETPSMFDDFNFEVNSPSPNPVALAPQTPISYMPSQHVPDSRFENFAYSSAPVVVTVIVVETSFAS